MKKGGMRAGAGRPKGSRDTYKRSRKSRRKVEPVASLPRSPAKTPLAYALAVMNDPRIDAARRDRMAAVAMGYCHPRVETHGKRKEAEEAAKLVAASGKFRPRRMPRLVADEGVTLLPEDDGGA